MRTSVGDGAATARVSWTRTQGQLPSRLLVKVRISLGVVHYAGVSCHGVATDDRSRRGSSGLQTEYVQALKGLINTFNWSRLFVILAGQRAFLHA